MVSGGAAALLSSVQRKGEGSQTHSRGTSRKRTRRQQNSLHSPTCARRGALAPAAETLATLGQTPLVCGPAVLLCGRDSPGRLFYGTSGAAEPQEGTTLADVPTVNRAPGALTHARARAEPLHEMDFKKTKFGR